MKTIAPIVRENSWAEHKLTAMVSVFYIVEK